MKGALGAFAVAFACLGVVGFRSGREAQTDDEVRFQALLERTKLVRLDDGEYQLVARFADSRRYTWDVTANVLVPEGSPAAQRSGQEVQVTLLRDVGTLATATVGAAIVAGVKDSLLTKLDSAKQVRVVALILGAASGYALGYKVGTAMQKDAAMSASKQWLEDPQTWKHVERAIYLSGWTPVRDGAGSLVDFEGAPGSLGSNKDDDDPLSRGVSLEALKPHLGGTLKPAVPTLAGFLATPPPPVLTAAYLKEQAQIARRAQLATATDVRSQDFAELAQLEARVTDNARVLVKNRPGAVAPKVEHKVETTSDPTSTWWTWSAVILLPLLSVAALVLIVRRVEKSPARTDEKKSESAKDGSEDGSKDGAKESRKESSLVRVATDGEVEKFAAKRKAPRE